MTIRVEQGKGGKDRYTVLSARLLEALRAYWKLSRPSHVAVPGAGDRTDRSHRLQRAYHARETAGGDHEAGRDSRAAARLCHAPAGGRGRRPHDSAVARPRLHHDDDALLASDAHTDVGLTRRSTCWRASPRRRRADRVRRAPRARRSSIARLGWSWRTLCAHMATRIDARTGSPQVQHRALRAIATCRTAALGGHQETCDRCGAVRITYNSCRNRHCPKCQTLTKERWLAARQADLLPIPYFHVVFTLPHDLNALAQGNPRVIYALLFRAAADTLLAFGRDPRHLGGTIGITAILHTWGQTLTQHLHLHCLVTGGALAADRSRWIAGRASFLFPVRALSTVFRAKYLAGLATRVRRRATDLRGGTADLADRQRLHRFLGRSARSTGSCTRSGPSPAPSRCSTTSAVHPPRRALE